MSGGGKEEFSSLVSAEWLLKFITSHEKTLGDSKVRILDGSWHRGPKGSGLEDWRDGHIPGALYFDIRECADTSDPNLRSMPPTVSEFEKYVGSRGINNETHLVVYDNNEEVGTFSAARVWWLFKMFGHQRISLLDGGFPEWKRVVAVRDLQTTTIIPDVKPQTYKAEFRPELVKSFEEVEANAKDGNKFFQLVDARSCTALAAGYIPGAVNLPYARVVDSTTKKMKTKTDLAAAFKEINLNKPITCMCFSGTSASNLVFALHLLGVSTGVTIYEGGWAEWAQRADDSMKVTGT